MLICLQYMAIILTALTVSPNSVYPWLEGRASERTIASAIQPPAGFQRIPATPGSFADWLRHLPLKRDGAPVLLFDGKEKPNQNAHVAVVDIDVGTKDLQQCADAVIRLRAEYLYSKGQYADIHFNFTSGDTASFAKWMKGYRPRVQGNSVVWEKTADEDASYASFRKYLDTVFMYAGSHSLSRELAPRPELCDMQIGDVFISGGFPGHAVIIVDIVTHAVTGEKLFLLAQSYMPAQDVHILKNPGNEQLSPWYRLPPDHRLVTPEWVFKDTELRFFKKENE